MAIFRSLNGTFDDNVSILFGGGGVGSLWLAVCRNFSGPLYLNFLDLPMHKFVAFGMQSLDFLLKHAPR